MPRRVYRLIMPQDPRGTLPPLWPDLRRDRRSPCAPPFGKGFGYIDGEGRTVRDKALKARIRQLAVPPAWTEVCIAEDERAHIQAVGRDAEGRLRSATTPIGSELVLRRKRTDCFVLVRRFHRLRGAVRKALSHATPHPKQGYRGGGSFDRSCAAATGLREWPARGSAAQRPC